MTLPFRVLLSVALLAVGQSCAALEFDGVYLDAAGDVHGHSISGKDVRLSRGRAALQAELAADHQTIAWLVGLRAATADGSNADAGSSELVVYRHGHKRSIRCQPFIRDFWFWKRGAYVGIDCGGAHFAGREILYEVRRAAKRAEFDQALVPAPDRPAWSRSGDNFRDE